MSRAHADPVQILLVEDSPGDARLTEEVLRDAEIANELHVVPDGEEAMSYLRQERQYRGQPRPDLVLLDLNLPRKDGREVLAELHGDPVLARIPLIVLTTSSDEEDVIRSSDLAVKSYITKPIDLQEFMSVVCSIEDFWLTIVRLPPS